MPTLSGDDPFAKDAEYRKKLAAHASSAGHKAKVETSLRQRLNTVAQLDEAEDYLRLASDAMHSVDGTFDGEVQAWRKFIVQTQEAVTELKRRAQQDADQLQAGNYDELAAWKPLMPPMTVKSVEIKKSDSWDNESPVFSADGFNKKLPTPTYRAKGDTSDDDDDIPF